MIYTTAHISSLNLLGRVPMFTPKPGVNRSHLQVGRVEQGSSIALV